MSPRGRGSALAIVMLLLLGISLLATSGLAGAVASLVLSGFEEQHSLAFEAAEAAVSRTLSTGKPVQPSAPLWTAMPPEVVAHSEVRHDPPGRDESWADGFSTGTGGTAFVLRHHEVRAEGGAGRGATVVIEQGFVTLVPHRGGMQ